METQAHGFVEPRKVNSMSGGTDDIPKIPKRSRPRAKTLMNDELQDQKLRAFVDETKRRLILLGFIPPRWENESHIERLGDINESDTETSSEVDPVHLLQKQISSVVAKYNLPIESNRRTTHQSRVRFRFSDVQSFEKVLIQPGLVLLRCIMQTTHTDDFDKVAKAIVCIFEANGCARSLFEWLIQTEIEHHNSISTLGTLFREDSLRIKVLSYHFQIVGKFYLQRVLGPVIKEAKQMALKQNIALPVMVHTLADMVSQQLTHLNNINCPDSIRLVCELTKQELIKRAPHLVVVALGNLVFLRWIAPSLIQPDKYGIVETPLTPEEQRVLVQVAKLLQTTVNSISEEIVAEESTWAAKNCSRILSYLIRLPKRIDEFEVRSTGMLDYEELLTYNQVRVLRDFETSKLYRYVRMHLEEIEWVWQEVVATPIVSSSGPRHLYLAPSDELFITEDEDGTDSL